MQLHVANLVCVAATTRTDGLAGFSNFGTTSVDLGAPGTEIISTWLAYDSSFADGFETAVGWANVEGSPTTWARTTESSIFGSWSATDSPSGPYGNFTNNWFRGAPGPMSFAGGLGCNVEYAMKLNTESGFDFFFVDASTHGLKLNPDRSLDRDDHELPELPVLVRGGSLGVRWSSERPHPHGALQR